MQTLPCICCKDVLQRCALALCEVTVLACRAFRQRLDQPVLVLHGADDAALGTRLLTGIEAAVPQVTPAGATSFLVLCDACTAIRSEIYTAVLLSSQVQVLRAVQSSAMDCITLMMDGRAGLT